MTAITITSFGYGHAPAPEATVVVDLRGTLPERTSPLQNTAAEAEEIRAAAFRSPGEADLRANLVNIAATLTGLAEHTGTPASLAVGSTAGRYPASSLAMSIADDLHARGYSAVVVHRDLYRDPAEH